MYDTIKAAMQAGLRHHQAGEFAAAKDCYYRALAIDANQADALHLLGVVALQTGYNETAVEMILAAIAMSPDFSAYHSNLGNALRELGRVEEAAAAYARAVELQPDYAEGHYNHGLALMDLRRVDEALAAFELAIRLKPDNADAISNGGRALLQLGRVEEGVSALQTAIRLRPDHAPGHHRLGDALLSQGRHEQAIAAYDAALRLQPGHIDALSNRGSALMGQGRTADALAAFQAVLKIKPSAPAHYNLGTALQAQQKFTAAIAAYDAAIALKPDYTKPHSNLIVCLHYQPERDAAYILQAAKRFAAHIEPRPRHAFANAAEPERRLRIGYVSGDFYHHTVSDFLLPVIENHDGDAVDVFCYSNSNTEDDVTARLRARVKNWRNIFGMTDEAAGEKIMADGVDILVDLSGHTNGNRLPLFARRAAPVQASWLGFWGTTGVPAMDYILSDADTIPPGQELHYSEQVLRLPAGRFCYQPPAYAPAPAAPPCLSGKPVVFGSFNNLAKLNPGVIRLWSQVLHAVQGARLLLKWKTLDNPDVRKDITAAFAACGIPAGRLILRGGSTHAKMLAEYADVDVALDPFPFSGGVTSCEALWMGVPVVTMPSEAAASRQTMSFLRAIGRMEWAARSAGDYIHAAAFLAEDKAKLADSRAAQRARMAASPLCDGAAFARQLEAAYRSMWRDWCRAGAPAAPAVEAVLAPAPQGLKRWLRRS